MIRNWWLLALCGILNAAISVVYFNHAGQGFRASQSVVLLGELAFLTVALLIVVMAIALWRYLHGLAGAASIACALAFLVLGFHWIGIERGSYPDLLLLGCYFAFTATCILGRAWIARGAPLPAANPALVHSASAFRRRPSATGRSTSRGIFILLCCFRAWARSWATCIRSHISVLPPKAFSKRSAIAGPAALLPCIPL